MDEGSHPARWSRRGGRLGRIGFAQAVPRWRDRRELRQTLRAVVREERVEQQQQITKGLELLAARRIPLIAVRRAMIGGETIEFRDGTVLQLDVRGGEISLERLANRQLSQVLLSSVMPISGRCWYRLRFTRALGRCVEVLARVDRFESTVSCYCRVRRRSSRRPHWHIGRGRAHL